MSELHYNWDKVNSLLAEDIMGWFLNDGSWVTKVPDDVTWDRVWHCHDSCWNPHKNLDQAYSLLSKLVDDGLVSKIFLEGGFNEEGYENLDFIRLEIRDRERMGIGSPSMDKEELAKCICLTCLDFLSYVNGYDWKQLEKTIKS